MTIGKKALRIEHGVVVGTASDKYESNNPIARLLVQGFNNGIRSLLRQVAPSSITEIGCGEGHVTEMILRETEAEVKALDISATVLAEARAENSSPRISFEQCNIYAAKQEKHCAELVVCCEVLEHLDDPERGLQVLSGLANPYVLLSVPREPLWCALNLARGAYLRDFGNTPGHLQHWSKRKFLRFVESRFDILHIRTPMPWTMVLGRQRQTGT